MKASQQNYWQRFILVLLNWILVNFSKLGHFKVEKHDFTDHLKDLFETFYLCMERPCRNDFPCGLVNKEQISPYIEPFLQNNSEINSVI
jgi:hypothetical protein